MSAEELKAIRAAAGMTQTEFAAALGVTRRAVALYEAGERAVSAEIAGKAGAIQWSSDVNETEIAEKIPPSVGGKYRSGPGENTATIYPVGTTRVIQPVTEANRKARDRAKGGTILANAKGDGEGVNPMASTTTEGCPHRGSGDDEAIARLLEEWVESCYSRGFVCYSRGLSHSDLEGTRWARVRQSWAATFRRLLDAGYPEGLIATALRRALSTYVFYGRRGPQCPILYPMSEPWAFGEHFELLANPDSEPYAWGYKKNAPAMKALEEANERARYKPEDTERWVRPEGYVSADELFASFQSAESASFQSAESESLRQECAP